MFNNFLKQPKSTTFNLNSPFIFILGMHRSGTSCLTGTLERSGLYLGQVARQSPHNLKGTHENKRVAKINDQILQRNGGTWQTPPPRVRSSWWDRILIKQTITRLSKIQPCGLKDPRLLLLLEVWLNQVNRFALVGTFRHPTAVAQSLALRNQLSLEQGYQLWLHYNARLVKWHQQYQFPLIEYNLAAIHHYYQAIIAITDRLGLRPNTAAIESFVTVSLNHHQPDFASVPPQCQAIYTYLKQAAM